MKGFIQLSHYAGMREDLIQAGGGNTSFKTTDGKFIVKASGYQLADLTEECGYAVINREMIVQYLDDLIEGKDVCSEKQILDRSLIQGAKPSIETFLHAITGTYTLHTHPVAANILLSRKRGMDELKKMFPDALMIGYATPGLQLAKLYYETYRKMKSAFGKECSLIFFENHGMMVSGNSVEETIRLNDMVLKKIESYIGIDLAAYHAVSDLYYMFCKVIPEEEKIFYKVENKNVIDLYCRRGLRMWDYQFCPDCMVYCGKSILHISNVRDVETIIKFIECKGEPCIITYNENIYIRTSSVKKAKEIESVLAFSALVVQFNENHEMNLLTEEEQDFLLNWDAEKYRQQMK